MLRWKSSLKIAPCNITFKNKKWLTWMREQAPPFFMPCGLNWVEHCSDTCVMLFQTPFWRQPLNQKSAKNKDSSLLFWFTWDCSRYEELASGVGKLSLFSFIIMPRNSQVRGLCNPVVDSSLLNSTLNYHVLCFLTQIARLPRFGAFRKRYASRQVWRNFRPSRLPFGDVTYS